MSEEVSLPQTGVPLATSPAPQVVLTLVNGAIQLQSNITPSPQAWLAIGQICAGGVQVALAQVAQQDQEAGPRIVVPTFQPRGLH